MLSAIKAESRKLLTVRSTYGIIIVSLLIVALFAGFGEGFHDTAAALRSPQLLMGESSSAIVFVGLILAFAGLLLTGNEYRYSTIMYTLSSTNRRNKILFAKFLVISIFAIITSIIVAFFSPLCTIVGVHLHGGTIGPQSFDYWSVIWRCVFCGWGYAMLAFILVAILRNQIGAIVTFLLVPLIGENIITAIWKSSGKYLPFTAVQSIAEPNGLGNHTTSVHAMTVVLVYVVVGLLASAVLFARRDAN
ncbi:MAG: hypothetical protein WDN27_02345 [Candidatus Saccharibacteria bacterium]